MFLPLFQMASNMSSDEAKLQMYNYYKLGCPIAWIQGFLNKFSLFKIKRDANSCISHKVLSREDFFSRKNNLIKVRLTLRIHKLASY